MHVTNNTISLNQIIFKRTFSNPIVNQVFFGHSVIREKKKISGNPAPKKCIEAFGRTPMDRTYSNKIEDNYLAFALQSIKIITIYGVDSNTQHKIVA